MTKKERLEYYKNLINNTGLCPSLKTQHPNVYEKLMELFLTHPDYPEKLNNVIDVAIIKNKINPVYFELQLINSNQNTDDISYLACINKPSNTKSLISMSKCHIHVISMSYLFFKKDIFGYTWYILN